MIGNLTDETFQQKTHQFGIWDYVVSVFILAACTCIGIYFAFKKARSGDVATNYFAGGRKMSLLPISLSLITGWLSSITLMGSSTEMYFYGTKYIFICLGMILGVIPAVYLFLPVFHEMKVSSAYEYLEKRFDKKTRIYGAVAFILAQFSWLPMDIYVPALAFNQVTGTEVMTTAAVMGGVCIFYATTGGFTGVIWSDIVQIVIVVGSVVSVAVKGTIDVGGFDVVWQRNKEGDRLEIPSFQLDFIDRHTFWSTTIGFGLFFLQTSFLDRSMIQQFSALTTLKQVNRAAWFFTIGTIFLTIVSCFSGLVVYATYYNCDPFTTGQVKEEDQILSLFVMVVLGNTPVMPGLFIAGLFSASLSTFAAALNSMSAIVLQDFINTSKFGKSLSDRVTYIIIKSAVILFGVISIGLVFIVEKLGTIIQASMSFIAVTSGPYIGIFCGGMLLPWMNADGAFYGALIGLVATSIIVVEAEKGNAMGEIQFARKPLSIEGCDLLHNVTSMTNPASTTESNTFPLYRMSYLWYYVFGTIVTLISSMVISYITGFNDPSKMDPLYFSPAIRRYLPKNKDIKNLETTETTETIETTYL